MIRGLSGLMASITTTTTTSFPRPLLFRDWPLYASETVTSYTARCQVPVLLLCSVWLELEMLRHLPVTSQRYLATANVRTERKSRAGRAFKDAHSYREFAEGFFYKAHF